MLERILPPSIDNTYSGHRLALWIFVPVLIFKTGIALGTIFSGRHAAQSADGIPLDSFCAAGAQAVVALFAAWGLAQLVFSLEHLARRLIFVAIPIARTGSSPSFYINLVLSLMMLARLILSLRIPAASRARP